MVELIEQFFDDIRKNDDRANKASGLILRDYPISLQTIR
jgi:hypothetical protein